jgi:HD-like signal output (HDOD) protein
VVFVLAGQHTSNRKNNKKIRTGPAARFLHCLGADEGVILLFGGALRGLAMMWRVTMLGYKKRASSGIMLGWSLKERIIGAVDNLAPMPQIMHKAREILDDPDSSLKDLADLMETDQALAVKVLRLSNSAYYCRLEKVASVQEAAVVLGMKTLGEMLTVACTQKALGRSLKGYGLAADALWRHSLSVAVGSRIIANRKIPRLSNEAFSAGLIHDTGKLILDEYVLEKKDAFDKFLAESDATFLDAEKKILGFDHAEIASRVCDKWNFPKTISTPVRYHHKPARFRTNELAYIVHVSDQIAAWSGMDTDGVAVEIGDKAFEALGMQVEDIGPIMDEVVASVKEIAKKMGSNGM